MSRKFWQRGPVSKMLTKPKRALGRTLRAVGGRGSGLERLKASLPAHLAGLERGLEVVDSDFPIREGQSRIDWLALSPTGELVFIWAKRLCNADTISKLLPDYDWIQKNQALWPHLFPRVLEAKAMRMKVWVFALEIDPEVRFLLSYLNGVRVSLFHCRTTAGEGWRFTPWEEFQKSLDKPASLPSAPRLLQASPGHSGPLLTHEEIQDFIHLSPSVETIRQEDEVTDPFFEMARPKV